MPEQTCPQSHYTKPLLEHTSQSPYHESDAHDLMSAQAVNVVASVPVFVADRFAGQGKPAKPGKPPGATKQMVTASAVSFTVVWSAMEHSARSVLVGARDATSDVVVGLAAAASQLLPSASA